MTLGQRAVIDPNVLPVIGLVGGIASGKSVVAKKFVELGAAVLDADRAGHKVLERPEIRNVIAQQFGQEVITSDGQVNRRALAQKVFHGEPATARQNLHQLEQLTHPAIADELCQQWQAVLEAGTARAVILDAPVLLKAGWDSFCTQIVFVEARREQRLARAAERGWSPADFDAREAAQESLDVKRGRADVIIDNSGSLACTHAQVERYWQSLIE